MTDEALRLADLSLARAHVDRAAPLREDPAAMAWVWADPTTRVVEIRGDRMAVALDAAGRPTLVTRSARAGDDQALWVFLGIDPTGPAYVAVIVGRDQPGPAEPPGQAGSAHGESVGLTSVTWRTLREVGTDLDDRDAGVFTCALALANWHEVHPRCPRCGGSTHPTHAGWVRRCPTDGSEHYPRSDPAVIMAIRDADDRLLLARNPAWPTGRFSVLAGFVEPGESLEAAVIREVAEEVGVDVVDVTYVGSQPWPFPCSLMIGCVARAEGTDLRLAPDEIAEARWVTRVDYLAALGKGEIMVPTGISIARRLIEQWLGQPVTSESW